MILSRTGSGIARMILFYQIPPSSVFPGIRCSVCLEYVAPDGASIICVVDLVLQICRTHGAGLDFRHPGGLHPCFIRGQTAFGKFCSSCPFFAPFVPFCG